MKLGKREKILAIASGVFIAMFLVDRIIITPFSSKLESTGVQATAIEEKMERARYIDSQRETILETFEKVKPYVQLGKKEGEVFSIIMKEIEEIAAKSSVSLISMKPEAAADDKEMKHKMRKLALNVEGPGSAMIQFFYNLESSNYFLRIHKMDFKLKSREDSIMKADMGISFIYFV